ncbi:MAG: sugar ABC transporter permease [Lachnospiraceae bacterium]|jgi:raffinose/stachyose/melibiose transport system permease protein|nr:sugar ABC transporter permease [Lachnospiraceae bacterium]
MAKRKREQKLGTVATIQSYFMIAGSVTGLILFVVIPLGWIVSFMLVKYKGYGTMTYVGLENFIRVFQRSPKYWLAVKNTFIFAFGKLAVEIPLALILAFLLTRDIKGQSFFRTMYFMPSMVSVAVIGVIFSFMFNSASGVVNAFMNLFGGASINWFGDGVHAMLVLMIASIWQNFGINMLFFMTGIQSISAEMYEAAAIDGASNTRQFFTITIPLLGPVLQMVLMNAVLGSLKVTDLVLTLTNGRPNGKTEVMMTYIYKYFFQQDGGNMQKQYGYGAALTVVTAVMLTLVTLVYLRATKKSSEIY